MMLSLLLENLLYSLLLSLCSSMCVCLSVVWLLLVRYSCVVWLLFELV